MDEHAETPQQMRGGQRVRVWDMPTRVFHWSLVALVVASYLTGEVWRGFGMQWHMYSGYAVLTLLVFRVAWGLVGTRHARFADFLYAPARTWAYLADLVRGRRRAVAGHNPLGGLSVLAFLGVLLAQAGSGLFASDDIFVEGPLAGLVSGEVVDAMTSVHHVAFDMLVGLVVLHILAIVFYEGVVGQRLVRAMIVGTKRATAAADNVPLAVGRGLAVLAVSAALVAALVWGLPALKG